MTDLLQEYRLKLSDVLARADWDRIRALAQDLERVRSEDSQVFLCGNGGSAANAVHWANDLIYGAGKTGLGGLRAQALPANGSVTSCLANDLGYAEVFSAQLRVLGREGDLLVVFSGSGDSANILRALEAARELKITSWAVVGYQGGRALALADHSVHFAVDDMQIAEDCQMVLGHVVTRFLAREM